MDPFDLTSQVAIVTGAGSGLGRASARQLAAAGALVVCTDIDAEAVAATARSITDEGHAARAAPLDVTDRQAVEDLVASTAEEHGRLDVMVNVAGITALRTVLKVDDDELDRVLAVNFRGTLNGCRAAGRLMQRAGRGAIVNTASSAVDRPSPGMFAYTTSKAAVVTLTTTLALELAPSGVRVNAVAPGFVDTPLTAYAYTDADGTVDEERRERFLEAMASSSPLPRAGRPDDVARAVWYLASAASSYVTGQILRPNGGATMPW